MATSKKNNLRDYLGLSEGSTEPVKTPARTALIFAVFASFFDFLISWLIFRDHFSHALGQTVTFFIITGLLMWAYLVWKKNQQQRLG